MSSTTTSTSASASASFPPVLSAPPGVSSSLYLFTFLITVLVLAIISGALLYRAYYIRRRFQARVEEAIRNNQPLPPDAARALGLLRPGMGGKKEKKLGPMPGMWEAEMLLQKDAGDVEKNHNQENRMMRNKWDEFTPLSIVHLSTSTVPEDYTPEYIIPPPRRRHYLPSWIPITQPLPRRVAEVEVTPSTVKRSGPKYTIPPVGEEVTVGVLIALPFEKEESWVRGEDKDEAEVPYVLLGVVGVRVE